MQDPSEFPVRVKRVFSRKLFWIAVFYALLLLVSGVIRFSSAEPSLPNDRHTAFVRVVTGERNSARKIRFAYKEFLPDTSDGALPVILVHGSPGDADTFNALAKIFPARRLISVDLPGYGESERDIPDYSIYAHSLYLSALLDQLGIEKAHLVGFSLGGGVIAHLADREPDRSASITFISSIGVQEYELFGDHYTNRFFHGLQLGLIWSLRELTPHFGLFDGGAVAYARNFYDTDQRPLRTIISRISGPFLIIHGRDDPLVPVEAAREHARIIPQSRYLELDDDHFFVFLRPEKLKSPLEDFWKAAEVGDAQTRPGADPFRTALAAKPLEYRIIRARGVTAFCFFILIAALTLLNEDLAFIISGVFAAQGRFGPLFALTACLTGIAVSVLLYRFVGKRMLTDASLGLVLRSVLGGSKARSLVDRIGRKPVRAFFFFRAYGFRSTIYLLAGNLRLPFWKTSLDATASSAIWGLVIIGFAFLLAVAFTRVGAISNENTSALVVAAVIIHAIAAYTVDNYNRGKSREYTQMPD